MLASLDNLCPKQKMKEFNNIKDIIWKHKPSEEENMFAKREK